MNGRAQACPAPESCRRGHDRPPALLATHGGFSYIETLVATVLLAVALVPAMESLQTGLLGASVHEQQAALHYRVAGRLEEMLSEPLHALDTAATAAGSHLTASSYSDPGGTSNRRLVYLTRYDVDNDDGDANPFSGGDDGIIWVQVTIEATSVSLTGLKHW